MVPDSLSCVSWVLYIKIVGKGWLDGYNSSDGLEFPSVGKPITSHSG